ncbi:hypothetical protein [Chloracidobacterium aggregatum]|uniref:hypothetical protein n=1 Tax=Chloracidobacterium aggregatum TaxID=2851959 RepID=UPI001B8CCD03|nr:hypothetical protein [Chloracidobacterium aggregatum]QUV90709.1 hypothetical protein J8C04_10750 [Chloracidobacterium sp. A]
MAAPGNPFVSMAARPSEQTRGLCPALAMYLSCVNCPFVAACPYKTRLGDFGAEAAAQENEARDRAQRLMTVLCNEGAPDAQRQQAADEAAAWLEADTGLLPHVRGRWPLPWGTTATYAPSSRWWPRWAICGWVSSSLSCAKMRL